MVTGVKRDGAGRGTGAPDARAVVILGSTGSVGRSTLDVVRALRGRFVVAGLSAFRSAGELASQVAEFRPAVAVLAGEVPAEEASSLAGACRAAGTRLLAGPSGLLEAARLGQAEMVVNALVGSAGIEPTLAAIEAGKHLALANKESLVAAGGLIVKAASRAGVRLMPVDSEHSAIHQCVRGEDAGRIRRIVLTASGGPLVDVTGDRLAGVSAEEALSHPTWNMGRKVTIDSATLVNKGFEVIEAHWLFGVEADRIEVLVERKSVVHSLVEFVDGSVSALLSPPDMRLPIQYALTYPERVATPFARLDLTSMSSVVFERPDHDRFPCLALAYQALAKGGTTPAVLSAADEVAVAAFLDGRIGFGDIHWMLSEVTARHRPVAAESLEAVLEADRWARQAAEAMVAARATEAGA
ncbi:MAG: 1-deoxy-D-xylulose-5-phosphate reductoisomerase [bacterium]